MNPPLNNIIRCFFSGPEANQSCVFPFLYENLTYNGCVKYGNQSWCSTIYIDDEEHWGWCGPDCALDEDIIVTWRTVNMTLQYNNNLYLWTGLELYGSILPWIFLLGLILTTGLPITG